VCSQKINSPVLLAFNGILLREATDEPAAGERNIVGQIAAVDNVGLGAINRDFGLMIFDGAVHDVNLYRALAK